jgi:hypothetical protein
MFAELEAATASGMSELGTLAAIAAKYGSRSSRPAPEMECQMAIFRRSAVAY